MPCPYPTNPRAQVFVHRAACSHRLHMGAVSLPRNELPRP